MQIDLSNISGFLNQEIVDAAISESQASLGTVLSRSGEGSDYLGWLDIPSTEGFSLGGYSLNEIQDLAGEIREVDGTMVCIGIGGSYLGHKAVISALNPTTDRILYAGHNISADYLHDLLDVLATRDEVFLNPISKSGTTTEPGIAFRILRNWMEERYGMEEASRRIIATTDRRQGALRSLADEKGYRTFPIPDSVGGRFSVLTPVGLFPIAVAGIKIRDLLRGAKAAYEQCISHDADNPALQYAAVRSLLYYQGRQIELLSSFEPRLEYFAEWWKQLAGESEGKDFKGLFPASAIFSTDLHSLGQWIQDGPPILFETFVIARKSRQGITIEESEENADNLNYLAGKSFDDINYNAYQGTAEAHANGGVPNLTISVDRVTARSLGELIFFFEMAVAVTGYTLGVNPFNQPGVEAYKTNMFRLLGKHE